MMVIQCPDCSADFAVDSVDAECPKCGGDLTDGALMSLDFVIQCERCGLRVGIQDIDSDGQCPECGEDSGFGGRNRDG
jgi:Zn finger protein HypA/HybF involved in hydrogenase expression